jgi:hypothetical protein
MRFPSGDKAVDMWKCVKEKKCNFVRKNIQDIPQICMCDGSRGSEICIAVTCKQKWNDAQTIKFECKYDLSKRMYCPQTSKNRTQRTNVIDNNKSDTPQKGENTNFSKRYCFGNLIVL